MTIADALRNVSRLFLDTAPVIYFVEQHPDYAAIVNHVFDDIDRGRIVGITSPITLAESLIQPLRLGVQPLQTDFVDLITQGRNTVFLPIGQTEAAEAAELRARHNLSMTDAFQVSVAMSAGCDGFLTNDNGLRRITEINVIVLADFTA